LNTKLERLLAEMPLIAILRHIRPDEAVAVGQALYNAGIRVMEVPLNSPEPYESIKRMREAFGETAVVGAGTVTELEQLDALAAVNCEIVVTPNTNPEIISTSIAKGMVPMPGFATPTEAFSAYAAGARYLKLFPASVYGTSFINAISAVLPKDVKMLAVGGVGASNAKIMFDAGVKGLGVGTEIYRAGDSADDAYNKGLKLVDAVRLDS